MSAPCILLDIEGTVAPITFVTEVMFPYVRTHLPAFLATQAETTAVRGALGALAAEAPVPFDPSDLTAATIEIHRLMDLDAKTTGLKAMQGLIWHEGFTCGELKAEVFDDVTPTLRAWQAAGRTVRIYSSGSVQAQRLFFAHTREGDLTPLLSGFYDTTSGPKKEVASYRTIAAHWAVAADQILFYSDVVAELDAAREAGCQTGLVVRPGNAPQPPHSHHVIHSFAGQ